MSKVYSKRVQEKELNFFTLASELGIAPKITKIDRIEDKLFVLHYQKWEKTLLKFPLKERGLYQPKIKEKLTLLHDHGIFHGDIKEDNIVINGNDEIAIIDYGLSRFIKDVSSNELKNNVYIFDDVPIETITELLKREIEEIEHICGMKCIFKIEN